uniref:surface-adhesin E family protein n=1 Tax=Rheinheimera sp. TaxID=1869214 RepID=UPI004048A692
MTFLLVSVSSSAQDSNWIGVGRSVSGNEFFIENSSIQRDGNSVTVWTKTNFADRDNQGNLSSKVQRTFNCVRREVVGRYYMTYDDIDNRGKLTYSGHATSSIRWIPIAPDSIDWAIMDLVCR